MESKTYINNHIQAGYDLVLNEEHTSIGRTMQIMRDAVLDNPRGVKAVVLELSPAIQPHIDLAAAGGISKESFILQSRISTEQHYIQVAGYLAQHGRITHSQFEAYEDSIAQRIENLTSRQFGAYTEEEYARDQGAFGGVYDLVTAAAPHGVPVIANNHGRERSVLLELDDIYSDEWIMFISDEADFEDLAQRIDINAPGSIIVHRGFQHSANIGGLNHREGFDDLLEDAGRKVRTIGIYENDDLLSEAKSDILDFGFELGDPSDALIVGGVLVAGNEATGPLPMTEPPSPSLSGVKQKF